MKLLPMALELLRRFCLPTQMLMIVDNGAWRSDAREEDGEHQTESHRIGKKERGKVHSFVWYLIVPYFQTNLPQIPLIAGFEVLPYTH